MRIKSNRSASKPWPIVTAFNKVSATGKAALRCLIFDVDGTLADTERDGHRVAFNQAFAESGLDWHWDETLYGQLLAVTGGKERIRYYQSRFLGRHVLDDEAIKALHARKTAHYLRLLQAGKIPLRPGVRRLLDEARQAGLTLAIATTTTPVNVTTLLENTLGPESLDWFALIAAGDIVPAKKPAPDIYHWALQKLALPAANCLALEDSRAGLLSAVQAGIPTVVTYNDYAQGQDFSEALVVANHLGEPDNPCRIVKGPAADSIDLPYLSALVGRNEAEGETHVA